MGQSINAIHEQVLTEMPAKNMVDFLNTTSDIPQACGIERPQWASQVPTPFGRPVTVSTVALPSPFCLIYCLAQ